MAKFKLSERARYVGNSAPPYAVPGREAVIMSIDCQHPRADGVMMLLSARTAYPGQVIYGVDWVGQGVAGGYIPESELEKIIPKHQEDDLKAAEPLFIQSQLPRWLGQEETKREKA